MCGSMLIVQDKFYEQRGPSKVHNIKKYGCLLLFTVVLWMSMPWCGGCGVGGRLWVHAISSPVQQATEPCRLAAQAF